MSHPLLAGVDLALVGPPGRPVEVAACCLRALGASVTVSSTGRQAPPSEAVTPPTGRLVEPSVVTPGADVDAGLPTGTIDQACAMALAAAALAARLGGPDGDDAGWVEVDPDAVAAHVLLPLVLAAATDAGPPAGPCPPRPTADGAVCADLAAEGDEEAFERLAGVDPAMPADRPADLRRWGSEDLARRAQEWRLPVTPYRRRPDRQAAGRDPLLSMAGAAPPAVASSRRVRRRVPLEGVVVADLTIMWSGPLATWLLAHLGARVVKVEPDCRLDGTRFSPGGLLFEALNAGKERAPLDLRRDADRRAFADLVGAADLVVDNFSPRVAPNLAITHADLAAVNPAVMSLSLPAFPPGPQRHWVSYGTGVHAASGLGDTGAGGFAAPIVTYPDPLGGLTAAVAALALLVARERGRPVGHAEVSLAEAIDPLLAVPPDGSLGRQPDPALAVGLARRLGTPPPSPLAVRAG